MKPVLFSNPTSSTNAPCNSSYLPAQAPPTLLQLGTSVIVNSIVGAYCLKNQNQLFTLFIHNQNINVVMPFFALMQVG
jgi:hypothetical protein